MTTYRQFVNSRNIRHSTEYADSNPNMGDANMNHWRVTLRYGRKRMTVPFSTGYGISGEPDAVDVLTCLASDSASVRYASSFDDWASDFGYDTDSRKAERIFKACERQADKLESFLGPDEFEKLLQCNE